MVSDSLPDTGHTVPSHNKEEGKGRMKGYETSRMQLLPPSTLNTPYNLTIWYFITTKKNSSREI